MNLPQNAKPLGLYLLFMEGIGLCELLFQDVSSVWLPAEQRHSSHFARTFNKWIPYRVRSMILK